MKAGEVWELGYGLTVCLQVYKDQRLHSSTVLSSGTFALDGHSKMMLKM